MEPEKVKVDAVHTSCRDCIFAIYKDKTQTGCQMGRIEPFDQQGAIIGIKDDEKEFFIINKRKCNAFQKQGGDFARNFQQADWVNVAKKMLAVRVSFFVLIYDAAKLMETVDCILSQVRKPFQTFFVNLQKEEPTPDIHVKLLEKIGNAITWRMVSVVDMKAGEDNIIDSVHHYVNAPYFSIFRAGETIPASFIEDINVSLNEKMERFNLLEPNKDGKGLTIQTEAFRHPQVRGNAEMVIEEPGKEVIHISNIVDKLRYYAEVESNPFMIKKVSDVCPSL